MIVIKNCPICKKNFVVKRKTQKFCDGICLANSRRKEFRLKMGYNEFKKVIKLNNGVEFINNIIAKAILR